MKKRDKRNRKKKRIGALVKMVLLMVAIGGMCFFSTTDFFNVTGYEVEGNSYYSKEEILIMGDCETGGNIFWDTKCKRIKDRLSKDAYMEEVKVRRILPSKVKIYVEERKQCAAVVYGDNYVVIDQNNIVLRKTNVAPQIPLIQGVTISKLELGQGLEIEEKVRFRQIMELVSILDENDMYFKAIVNSETEVKAFVLDNLACEGAPEDLMHSIEGGELQKVIRGLFDREIERGTVKVSGGNYISFSPEIN